MNRTPISSLDALRTCHQGERESVFILSSLLNGQPIIHIIGLNLITRPPEPYETMPSSCLQWWQMLAHGRQNNRRIWFPGHLHMHTMTAWAKGAWMDRRRENADPCSGEHHHGKASCEILNAFHAGSVMPPNTLLADDAIGTGTRPGIPLGSPSCSLMMLLASTVMTSNRRTSAYPAFAVAARFKLYLSFLSISLLVFFALICTGLVVSIERIIASQAANTRLRDAVILHLIWKTINHTLLDDNADRLPFMIIPVNAIIHDHVHWMV